jgi:hypothetical protein
LIIDESAVGTYHCSSQCVRRTSFRDATKGGLDLDHRREWFRKRLESLASLFAVQVTDFAIIDNQFHVILRNRPDLSATLTALEVARRWQRLSRASLDLRPVAEEKVLKKLSAKRKWVSDRKRRLSSISWFMLMLKEPIARAANAEDGVRGHFFGARFESLKLADDEQVLVTSLHVNSLAVRLGLEESVASERFTAAQACLTGTGDWLADTSEANPATPSKSSEIIRSELSREADCVVDQQDHPPSDESIKSSGAPRLGSEDRTESTNIASYRSRQEASTATVEATNTAKLFHRLPLEVYCDWLAANSRRDSAAIKVVERVEHLGSGIGGVSHERIESTCDAGAAVVKCDANLWRPMAMHRPALQVPEELPRAWDRFGLDGKRWSLAVPLIARRFRRFTFVAEAMRHDSQRWAVKG